MGNKKEKAGYFLKHKSLKIKQAFKDYKNDKKF